MKRYLLDTSICVFLFRGKFGINEKLNKYDSSQIFISDVTLAELKYGAYRSSEPEYNLLLIERLISKVSVVPFSASIDIFARTKDLLRRKGITIEDFDLLIASSALAYNLILITDNIKHFSHVENLELENWVVRS